MRLLLLAFLTLAAWRLLRRRPATKPAPDWSWSAGILLGESRNVNVHDNYWWEEPEDGYPMILPV